MIVNLILVAFLITYPGYVSQKADVSRTLGTKWNGGTLTNKEYQTIVSAFEVYHGLIQSGDYESAYQLATRQYRQAKDLETFIQEVKVIQEDGIFIDSISPLTSELYEVMVQTDEESASFLVLMNETSSYVIPGNLIDYQKKDTTLKKDNILFRIISIENDVDSYHVELEISNLSKSKESEIKDIRLKVGSHARHIEDFHDLILSPQETKTLQLSFETYLDFPSGIDITCVRNQKSKVYHLDL